MEEHLSQPPDASIADREHLRLLSIFHYVLAGITALFACFPMIHVALGAVLILAPEQMSGGSQGGPPPPEWLGLVFVLVGGFFVLAGWTIAILTFISGRYIKERKNRLFSIVIAGVQCAFFPFGTVLGVFTFIVLLRDSVRRLYA